MKGDGSLLRDVLPVVVPTLQSLGRSQDELEDDRPRYKGPVTN